MCVWVEAPGAAHMPGKATRGGVRRSARSMRSFHARPVRWVPSAPLYTQGQRVECSEFSLQTHERQN